MTRSAKWLGWQVMGARTTVALWIAPWFRGQYTKGYLQGIRHARAAIPGDVNQPALVALDEMLENLKLSQSRERVGT